MSHGCTVNTLLNNVMRDAYFWSSNHHPGWHLQRNFDWDKMLGDKAWWGERGDNTNVKFQLQHSSHHISLILMPPEGSRLNISLIKYTREFRTEIIYFIGSWHHSMLLQDTKVAMIWGIKYHFMPRVAIKPHSHLMWLWPNVYSWGKARGLVVVSTLAVRMLIIIRWNVSVITS